MDIFIIITLTITSIASIVYLLNLSKKEISGTKGIPQNHEKKANKSEKNDREDFIV
ncbi:MAG: hypothetical protein ACJ0FN_04970 [Gammaproteobacteria bacterium]|jgi:hypothetical protein|nr:hypothetical protein M9C80_06195 [SAR86 cluster bacterium]|tara:strand:+ start:1424 stop:1591 length:168 start_codon:yes stop_codon:yes gene_type:complete